MKKIHIAVMADDFDRRPERTLFWRHVIEALVASPEFDVTLVHSQAMPEETMYQRAREVIIPRVNLPWGSRFASFIRYCLTTKDRFDIVYSFSARLYPFFWLFPAKRRVAMAHGGGERLSPGSWTFPRFVFVVVLRLFHRYVDALIAVSDYGNREIIYAYHVPPKKVFTIYPHVDATFAHLPSPEAAARTLAEDYGLKAGKYFIYIGRARIHKNIGNLVESYLRYREANPQATELLAIGGDSREEYEKTFGPVRNSPYAADIRFLGYVPNDHMAVLYTGAAALAFVTLNEGFGVPIVEGMACGTPVITASVTAMPEVAGDAALIVDPRNPDALSEAFRLVATDERLRAELIRRGLERCKIFTWEAAISKTFALFRKMVESEPLVYNPISPHQPPTNATAMPYVNAGLKVPLLEAVDRYTILSLKRERLTNEQDRPAVEAEFTFYCKVLDAYRAEGVEVKQEWIEQMRKINDQIWGVEAEIRNGRRNNLTNEQVGHLAVKLRDLNDVRGGIIKGITSEIDMDFYAFPDQPVTGIDTSLKLPLHEAIDRLTIAQLKSERLPEGPGREAARREHAFYRQVVDSYRRDDDIDIKDEWIASMYDMNGRVWDREGAIRQGREGEFGLEEMGRRTLELREMSKERVTRKNAIAAAIGSKFYEVKTEAI